MTVFVCQIQNGGLVFDKAGQTMNGHRWADFKKNNEGEFIRIENMEKEPYKIHRFFEGAVVKYYFYQHGLIVPFRTFIDARESLKLQFYPVKIVDDLGQWRTIGGSLSQKSNKFFQAFLDRIEENFKERGYEFPSSKEYRDWIDTVPDITKEFPPLLKLIENYKLKKNIVDG